jgi:hypothetical protein
MARKQERRVVTILPPKYYGKFKIYCERNEERPASALRRMVRKYFEEMEKAKPVI